MFWLFPNHAVSFHYHTFFAGDLRQPTFICKEYQELKKIHPFYHPVFCTGMKKTLCSLQCPISKFYFQPFAAKFNYKSLSDTSRGIYVEKWQTYYGKSSLFCGPNISFGTKMLSLDDAQWTWFKEVKWHVWREVEGLWGAEDEFNWI